MYGMKLKTLVGSMMVLGLVSGSAFAAAPVADPNGDAAFWANNVTFRNQDNSDGVVALQTGQTKITGAVATTAAYNTKRSSYATNTTTPGNDDGSLGLSLSIAELYLDSQVNDWTSVHIAMDYDPMFPSYSLSTAGDTANPTYSSAGTGMFFPEAYATFTHNNMFAKVGRQYANFGSTMRDSLSMTLVAQLATVNASGVTVGIQNVDGFYADAFIYQGTPYGSTDSGVNDYATINSNASMVHGYSLDLGYAHNQGTNVFYGNNGYNAYVDYIGNIADTLSFMADRDAQTNTHATPLKQVGGLAVHGDYTTGAFQVLADYVTAVAKFNAGASGLGYVPGATTTDSNQPSAYGVQAAYAWNENLKQRLTLGYEGTAGAAGVRSFYSNFTLPEMRMLVSYDIKPMANVDVAAEYTNDKDYSIANSGTGESNNTVQARLKVVF
jgi:hypothetical protein